MVALRSGDQGLPVHSTQHTCYFQSRWCLNQSHTANACQKRHCFLAVCLAYVAELDDCQHSNESGFTFFLHGHSLDPYPNLPSLSLILQVCMEIVLAEVLPVGNNACGPLPTLAHNGTNYVIAEPGTEWELRLNIINSKKNQRYKVSHPQRSSAAQQAGALVLLIQMAASGLGGYCHDQMV